MATALRKRLTTIRLAGFLALAGLASGFSSVRHPFYVSVTEVDHNAADRTLEISSKVFAEDIEQVLEKNYKTQLDITIDADKTKFDQYLADYFAKHLSITADGRHVSFSYLGYEVEKESAYCYFQVDNVPSVKNLHLNNTILYDFNDTEINIMHITIGGRRQSSKVVYPEATAEFKF